jgi:uncharacterized protein (TIGR01615 family)
VQVLSVIQPEDDIMDSISLSVVLARLHEAGFKSAEIRTTTVPSAEPNQQGQGSILRRLQHRFIVLSRGFLEIIVDVGFRSNFELPGLASASYNRMLDSLPENFVGSRAELSLLVAHITQSMAHEFVRKVR